MWTKAHKNRGKGIIFDAIRAHAGQELKYEKQASEVNLRPQPDLLSAAVQHDGQIISYHIIFIENHH